MYSYHNGYEEFSILTMQIFECNKFRIFNAYRIRFSKYIHFQSIRTKFQVIYGVNIK